VSQAVQTSLEARSGSRAMSTASTPAMAAVVQARQPARSTRVNPVLKPEAVMTGLRSRAGSYVTRFMRGQRR